MGLVRVENPRFRHKPEVSMLDIWVSTGKIWAQYGSSTGLSWSLFFPHKNPSSTQFSSATGHSCGFWLLPSSWCSSVVLNCRIWAKTRGFHKKPEVLLRFWRTRGLSANPLILKGLAAKGAKGIYIHIYTYIYICMLYIVVHIYILSITVLSSGSCGDYCSVVHSLLLK